MKRIRKSFGKIKEKAVLPDLIALQRNSYESFLQKDVSPEKRECKGLEEIFQAHFPILDNSGNIQLDYCGYYFDEVKSDEMECKKMGTTYSVALRCKFRLLVWKTDDDTGEKSLHDIREQDVYLGDFPLMTDRGTFIFNGIERVVVSQVHRSPGVFFDHDGGKVHSSGKFLYSGRIIPYRGTWLDFEFDHHDVIYLRVDRGRRVLATTYLMCLDSKETEEARANAKPGEFDESKSTGMSIEEIVNYFYGTVVYRKTKNGLVMPFRKEYFLDKKLTKDLVNADTGEVVAKEGTKLHKRMMAKLESDGIENIMVDPLDLIGCYIAKDDYNRDTGEVYFNAGEKITEEKLQVLLERKDEIEVLDIDNITVFPYIINTLAQSNAMNRDDAYAELLKSLDPGEHVSLDAARELFQTLGFDEEVYDLSDVGRAKVNYRINNGVGPKSKILCKQDILAVIKILCDVKNGDDSTDDIDDLGNRRVRSVGELVENQCRVGMTKIARSIKEKMVTTDCEVYIPSDLINSKPLMIAIKDFFISSQLSQFMDQTNQLSEVTHKRRLSALGAGGLARDRASFEVRDIHSTHYSRLCPVETPEGQNIGLINSLTCFARINQYGFIEAPYRKVVDGKATDEIEYLTATEEAKHFIAQSNIADENGEIKSDEFFPCRTGVGSIVKKYKNEIEYMDVSPKQVVSVTAALIPFIEKDEATRALMGSNMQRQAVPLLRCQAPLVGTGMEAVIAKDSGSSVTVKRDGIIDYVDSSRIVVRVMEEGGGVDIYDLLKYQCSNMGTCINQRPLVKVGDTVKRGDIIADGSSTDLGELALGRNLLVAFMCWNGYSFEDSIVLSRRVVEQDLLTSIHIDSFEVVVRDTKLGNEEITRDISSISEESLRNLDESGIICIGSEVKPGDILVGKVTPRGETPIIPEEKLLRAIFGEKAADVKDTSLRVPPGVHGTVIDVRVLVKKGVEKDERTLSIERKLVDDVVRDCEREKEIHKNIYRKSIINMLEGQTVESCGVEGMFERGTVLTKELLSDKSYFQIATIVVSDKAVQQNVENIVNKFNEKTQELEERLHDNIQKIRAGNELPSGVLKMVKVFIANKRKIQVGDKMAGRHGNKGVVSKIVPVEDMPYLADGTPVDIVLNPLSLNARMNLGQIFETNLGAAAKGLGDQIQKMLDEYRKQQVKIEELRDKLLSIYHDENDKKDIKEMTEDQLLELAKNLTNGVPMATPVFDGATVADVDEWLEKAGLDKSGQVDLYDGRTGEKFDRKVTVGYKYMLKLHHLVDDKIHARSIGPYSLITQQPLGGKAQFGGQRFGEMEVWALEGYGAAYALREMLTIKSDDVVGRTRAYEAIVSNSNDIVPEIPESFNVLKKELSALCFHLSLEKMGNHSESNAHCNDTKIGDCK